MSQLTSDVKVVYYATYYKENLYGTAKCYRESDEYDTEEEAVTEAKDFVASEVERFGIFVYAEIHTRIVPIYK